MVWLMVRYLLHICGSKEHVRAQQCGYILEAGRTVLDMYDEERARYVCTVLVQSKTSTSHVHAWPARIWPDVHHSRRR